MRTLAVRLGIIAALTVGLLGLSDVSARAADKNGSCDPGEVCFWRDVNSQGCLYDTSGANEDDHLNFNNVRYNTCPKVSLNDSMTSYANKTGRYLVLYENPATTGFEYCVPPGASGNVINRFNDKASSYVRYDPGFDERRCGHVDRD